MLKVTLTNNETETIVALEGRMDTAAAPEFEQALAPVWEMEQPRIMLDCQKLEYISSSGLRTFLKLKKFTDSKGGQVALNALQPTVKEVFDMTGRMVFEILDADATIELPLDGFHAGTYVVRISQNDSVATRKLSVLR